MSSYFPFSNSSTNSSSSSNAAQASSSHLDDPHLQVTVTPSASAYYAGETFSVTITFRNTRTPPLDASIPRTPTTVSPTAEVRTATSATRQLPPFQSREAGSNFADLPQRRNRIGRGFHSLPLTASSNADAGPSRLSTPLAINTTPGPPPMDPGYPYSPGANTSFRASGWISGQGGGPTSPQRDGPMNFRSPDGWGRNEYAGSSANELGHTRRSRSLALGKGAMSPQELVWALGGHPSPPPLPSRRPQSGSAIPVHHPHSRKISVNNLPPSPPSSVIDLTSPPPLRPVSERYSELAAENGAPSRPNSRPTFNRASSSTSTQATTADDDTFISNDAMIRSKSRPAPSPSVHGRTPSYHNAYGASFLGLQSPPPLPPPTHPYIRERLPTDRGTTTILWAYTRLVAQFHPSNAYIPPDPLLPLRSRLLHQPVGSGSLSSTMAMCVGGNPAPSSSRWQLSFGTGTIGNSTQPSLTGSLFGLAKDLVMGGGGGSLEEERKRVWNMKDLPVLETTRSLLGVDVKLREGETKEFTYTLQLPTTLPPAHRGKAFRFSYDLVVSLTVALPGGGQRQKSKEINVPVRVWANVSVNHPFRTYDVLEPIIQTKEEGKVREVEREAHQDILDAIISNGATDMRRRSSASDRLRTKSGDTPESLQAYARHLVDTLEPPSPPISGNDHSPRPKALSPNRANAKLPRSRVVSPSSPAFNIPPMPSRTSENGHARGSISDRLDVPHSAGQGALSKGFVPRPRGTSFVEGDDELVEEAEGGCGEAVEILSRHSSKASYDIAKDGEVVAVVTLIKTTYRLGETVLGVVTFNEPATERRVLKFSAYLESHELIPQPLLPPPGDSQPPLARLHAEHHSSYVVSSSRLAFSLDIPSDATPDFSLAAGEGDKGGLIWKVKLRFVVAVPASSYHYNKYREAEPRRSESGVSEKARGRKGDGHDRTHGNEAVSLVPTSRSGTGNDGDNRFYSASTTLTPLLPAFVHAPNGISGDRKLGSEMDVARHRSTEIQRTGSGSGSSESNGSRRWQEMKTELVECEVPVKVLAGNTAFVVRPSVWVI